MHEQYRLAGKGLFLVFVGQILNIFALIPIVGAILSVVGLVLTLVGLHSAGQYHPGYKTAFTVSIVSLVISVINIFAVGLLGIVTAILSLVIVYYICTATAELLSSKGDGMLAEKGLKIWKMYKNCTIVTVVCLILAFVPILGIIAAIVAFIAAIVLIVAGILYIIFLYKAQASLQS